MSSACAQSGRHSESTARQGVHSRRKYGGHISEHAQLKVKEHMSLVMVVGTLLDAGFRAAMKVFTPDSLRQKVRAPRCLEVVLHKFLQKVLAGTRKERTP